MRRRRRPSPHIFSGSKSPRTTCLARARSSRYREAGVSSRRPRRGQVFFADLEDIGRKLVLVVSADEVNDRLSPVVCLLTSTERERALPTFVTVDPPEAGLWKPTAILCHNLVTLDLWRLADEPIGSVSV